jgi:hypothetical protein
LISDDKTAFPGRDAADHTNESRFCKRPEISRFLGLLPLPALVRSQGATVVC